MAQVGPSLKSIGIESVELGSGNKELTFRVTLLLTFVIGFFAGYKTKEWRMRWLRFRRDRLAKKLADANKLLDLQAPAL